MAGQNPATLVASSEGKEGEEQEELASYLVVCSVWVGTAGGSSPA